MYDQYLIDCRARYLESHPGIFRNPLGSA